MKVLQIHNRYRQYGGEDAVVENESRLLKDHGQFVRQLFFDNTTSSISKLFYNKEAYYRVQKEIQDFKPDVVHVHNIFYNASPSVLKAARDAGIPVVMTLHNFRLLCAGALFLREGKACTKCKDLLFPYYGVKYRCFQNSITKSTALSIFIGWQKIVGSWQSYVDKFIVLTPYIKSLFMESSLNIPENNILVKPNSTDDAMKFNPDRANREGFVFVGRLSEEKGIRVLIEAFNRIPKIDLSVIGTGELEEEVKKIAGPHIHFYGKREKEFIIQKLFVSKALIFPSIWYEGLPNTVIEAFSAGTPVIASNIENINQIIEDGYNGLLFETANPVNLANQVSKFHKENTAALEIAARKTYEKQYSHKDNFNSLMELYQSLS